jgi:asparagine synthetase B (glutamine-hydrolysing)
MCGIAGEIVMGGRAADTEAVAAMSARLADPVQARRQHDDGMGAGGAGAVPRSGPRRTRCRVPARPEGVAGGKGVLKDAARRLLPSAVIDRPKGYFPVSALRRLDEDMVTLVRDALLAPEAQERPVFEPRLVERLLADPNARHTRVGGNVLWQVGLLELWLQQHGVG